MKQLPNLFTLLNLFFGCMALVVILQPGISIVYSDTDGAQYVQLPEKIWMASLFIAIAAVIDFLDGFVARLLQASSDMGKQLDSLADVVSFGVAPGMILYQLLRLSFAQQQDGLDVNPIWLYPAFLLPCAGAYRLARFNIDTSAATGFKGVPIPAAGLLTASLPLIYWHSHSAQLVQLLLNKWVLYGYIVVVSGLMVSTLPMLALKFKQLSFQKMLPFLLMAAVGMLTAFFMEWVAVPVTFIAYVILSLIYKTEP